MAEYYQRCFGTELKDSRRQPRLGLRRTRMADSREAAVDEFRRVTGAAMRAIAEHDDVKVSFATGPAGHAGGQRGALPLPAARSAAEGSRADARRGGCDGARAALPRPQAACPRMPAERDARPRVFEAIEHRAGRGDRRPAAWKAWRPISRRMLDEHCRQRAMTASTERERRAAGRGAAAAGARGDDRTPPPRQRQARWSSSGGRADRRAARADLAELGKLMNDQRAYAKATRRLLTDLDLDLGAGGSRAPTTVRRRGRERPAGRARRGQGRGRREGQATAAPRWRRIEGEGGTGRCRRERSRRRPNAR